MFYFFDYHLAINLKFANSKKLIITIAIYKVNIYIVQICIYLCTMSKKMHHIVLNEHRILLRRFPTGFPHLYSITSMANNEIISKILFQEIIMRSCFIPFLYTLNDELCSFLLIIFQEHNLSCRELHLMHIITPKNLF